MLTCEFLSVVGSAAVVNQEEMRGSVFVERYARTGAQERIPIKKEEPTVGDGQRVSSENTKLF